jgi:hypothetical protein
MPFQVLVRRQDGPDLAGGQFVCTRSRLVPPKWKERDFANGVGLVDRAPWHELKQRHRITLSITLSSGYYPFFATEHRGRGLGT